MKSVRLFLAMAAVFSVCVFAIAQEGHPLTGTWYGDFGMTAAQRNDLTVIMKWDGANTTGMVNPGPNAVPLKVAKLDVKLGTPGQRGTPAQGGNPAVPAIAPTPPVFSVHFEADAKNKAGGMDHFVFDGKLENPVAGNRTIVGTWTCGNTRGDFRLRRL
jgi:hypothetical protein